MTMQHMRESPMSSLNANCVRNPPYDPGTGSGISIIALLADLSLEFVASDSYYLEGRGRQTKPADPGWVRQPSPVVYKSPIAFKSSAARVRLKLTTL